jgi:hypothetical protein
MKKVYQVEIKIAFKDPYHYGLFSSKKKAKKYISEQENPELYSIQELKVN